MPIGLEQESATEHNTALLICFGGNGRSQGFSRMVASSTARKKFLQNLVRLMDKHALDGVDYNWEYPGYEMGRGYLSDKEIKADYEGLMKLFRETRAILGPRAPITMSYYPDGRQEELLRKGEAAAQVDYLMMMSYDQTGQHHSEARWGNGMIDQGVSFLPPNQVAAGLPFYGRHSTNGNWVTYEDIVQHHQGAGWWNGALDEVVTQDERGRASKLGFNGVDTIFARTAYAAEKAGGVMIWEVGQDCRIVPTKHADGTSHVRTCPGEGDQWSLLAAITRARVGANRELVQFKRSNKGISRQEL